MKIDLHFHTSYPGGPERLRGGTWPTPEQVRGSYRRFGIRFGVLQSLASAEHSHDPITSRMACALSAEYPDVAGAWFCHVDPRMMNNDAGHDLSYYFDFYRERGAKGAGEVQANLNITGPLMLSYFRSCEKSGLPVLLHMTRKDGYGVIDAPGLPGLEQVLANFPKLNVIGHAQGFWSNIGFRRNGSDGPKCIEQLLQSYPNLYCDISAASGFRAMTSDEAYSASLLERFSDRFFFGTDISSPETLTLAPERLCGFLDRMLSSGALSRGAYDRICAGNAERLLAGCLA